MKKETKKAPTIRFRDFTDDWEQRKFDEIASRESSTGMSSEILPSVEYEDVISEVGQLNKDIAEKAVHKKGIKFDKIHVLYGKLRPYLHNWINPRFKGIAVGDWWVLKPVATDKDFLYRLIQTKQFDDIANLSTGSKMPRADWNLVSKSEFMIPGELKEQHLIGQCFSNLDNLITLHQRKLDQLKTLKKYFLQNMFPAKGEKVPRIRFKGFTGDWEQRKFGEIAEYKKGPFGSALKKEFFIPDSDISIKVYEQQNAINKDWTLSRYYISQEYAQKLKAFEVHSGDIIVSCAGTIGEIYELPAQARPGIINQALMRIRVNKDIVCKDIFKLAFSNMIDSLSREFSNGSAIKNIPPFADLKPMKVLLPDKTEQKLIGDFFTDIDKTITLHQRKLNQLQTMKKFMLQNLFI